MDPRTRQQVTHYGAPAAFLAAVTIAVILMKAGLNGGAGSTTTLGAPDHVHAYEGGDNDDETRLDRPAGRHTTTGHGHHGPGRVLRGPERRHAWFHRREVQHHCGQADGPESRHRSDGDAHRAAHPRQVALRGSLRS